MDPEVFGMVKSRLSAGIGADVVRDILECAALATHAETSAIIEWHDDHAEIVAAFGLPVASEARFRSTSALESLFRLPVATGDLPSIMKEFDQADTPVARYVVSTPVKLGRLGRSVTLTCWRNRTSDQPSPDTVDILSSLAGALRNQLRLMGQVLAPSHFALSSRASAAAETPAAYTAPPPAEDGAAVVTDFLLKTLPTKRRLLTRDGVSYHTLRTWRAGIKDWQIAALRSAKLAPPPPLVNAVAAEITAEVGSLVGGAIANVMAVPCGHSTGTCFSREIGVATAAALNVPFDDGLSTERRPGSSHPKTNTRRPPMRLSTNPAGPIVLIDDVATSGAHIAEATRLLRATGAIVFPIAWIGA